MTEEEKMFFAPRPEALPIYEALRPVLLSAAEKAEIRTAKTQISFKDRYLYAAVSFTPVRRKAERPPVWLTLSLGLWYRPDSPRVAAAAEPYPGRWTVHFLLGSAAEADEELRELIGQAAFFAREK